jgi:hypothetical protein
MRQKEALVIAGEVHSQANTRLFLPDSCPHIKLDTDSCSPAVELAEDTTANRGQYWLKKTPNKHFPCIVSVGQNWTINGQ